MKIYAIKKEKKNNKLSNYIPNMTAVISAVLKALPIKKPYSESV